MKRLYGLAMIAALALPVSAMASGVLFDNGILTANLDPGTLSNRGCGAGFDGTYYWTAEAGFSSGTTINQYDASGNYVAGFETGIDHRSVFTDGSGNTFASTFGGGDIQIYQYIGGAPNLLYSLSSNPNAQMELGLRIDDNRLYGHSEGTIYVYDFANGQQVDSFPLSGYAGSYPANVQVAVANGTTDYLLTYNDSGVVNAWDFAGNNMGACTIGLASFDQIFSFSFANGLLWIETAINGTWNGYDIGLSAPTPVEETSWGSIKAAFK